MFCVYCTHDMRFLHETSNKSPERVQNGSPTCLTRLAQTTVTAPGSVRVTHSRSRKKPKKIGIISTLKIYNYRVVHLLIQTDKSIITIKFEWKKNLN